jgi:hypothetical protein
MNNFSIPILFNSNRRYKKNNHDINKSTEQNDKNKNITTITRKKKYKNESHYKIK